MNDDLARLLRDVPDFPKPGILFKDITPLLRDPVGFRAAVERLGAALPSGLSAIVGVEARGFIFGAAVAAHLGVGFVPARKKAKLPAAVDRVTYALEYGEDCLEMHKGTFAPGDRVAVVDDVIATGGTARAAIELAQMQGAEVVATGFVIELAFLNGRAKLPAAMPVHTLLTF
ncbi:MAG: adenine phosphoribosyltransferase [Polyangiales bacterium]